MRNRIMGALLLCLVATAIAQVPYDAPAPPEAPAAPSADADAPALTVPEEDAEVPTETEERMERIEEKLDALLDYLK